MSGNEVRLANGQIWTTQNFLDHYLRPRRANRWYRFIIAKLEARAGRLAAGFSLDAFHNA